MNTDGTGFYTRKECHQTESLWNHITTDHKEEEQLEDRRNAGENSCNSGEGTDQRVQSLMFMMMIWWYHTPHTAKCVYIKLTFTYKYNRQAEQLVNILFMCRIWNSRDGNYEKYKVFWDITPRTASIFRVEYGGITFVWGIGQFLLRYTVSQPKWQPHFYYDLFNNTVGSSEHWRVIW